MAQADDIKDADREQRLPLIAYPISPLNLPLMAAPAGRAWMEATPSHFAKRCLPMLIANRSGWLMVSMHTFAVTWDGRAEASGLTVTHLEGAPPYSAHSQFGSGILTFVIPFLFRTPPGINLLVRGPANFVKDGIAPLDGVVETDWAEATFTMNWKMTRPHNTVTFTRGEPVAMIVPQERGSLEHFDPVVRDIATDAETMAAYVRWAESREAHNKDMQNPASDAYKLGWEKHYFKGTSADGAAVGQAAGHQLKVALKDFADEQ